MGPRGQPLHWLHVCSAGLPNTVSEPYRQNNPIAESVWCVVVGQRELIAAIASFATCDSGEIVLGDVKNPLPAAGDLVTVGPRIGAGMVPTLGREIVGACKRCH